VSHHRENEDEMFLVVKGRFRMEFATVTNGREESCVVPAVGPVGCDDAGLF
jgi:mannose-6-phosphate isomerase-like protein (cupin superfamily)